jgi:hypothetical protein
MNLRLLTILLALLTFSAFAAKPAPGPSIKKGVGLAERKGKGLKQLTDLNVGWYYNWSSETAINFRGFVPMVFSLKHVHDNIRGDIVLGFNEPDHKEQSNIAIADALAAWPEVARKAKLIGSPSMAGNPVTSEWFTTFMKARPRVDFITVHWYKGADARKFINDMTAIHNAYKLPLWITEFAPQTHVSAGEKPDKFSQSDVNQFIREVVQWMENTPWIYRYAWHDAGSGTSALFDDAGNLTPTGKAYAAAH